MSKRGYHRARYAVHPNRRIIRPVDGDIRSEHVMTIYNLYHIDGMSVKQIADLYERSDGSIARTLKRARQHSEDPDNFAAARYFARAQQYAEVLRLLDEKRTMSYRAIHIQTRLSVSKIAEIAQRNGLER